MQATYPTHDQYGFDRKMRLIAAPFPLQRGRWAFQPSEPACEWISFEECFHRKQRGTDWGVFFSPTIYIYIYGGNWEQSLSLACESSCASYVMSHPNVAFDGQKCAALDFCLVLIGTNVLVS